MLNQCFSITAAVTIDTEAAAKQNNCARITFLRLRWKSCQSNCQSLEDRIYPYLAHKINIYILSERGNSLRSREEAEKWENKQFPGTAVYVKL